MGVPRPCWVVKGGSEISFGIFGSIGGSIRSACKASLKRSREDSTMTNRKPDPFFRNLAIAAPLATVLGVVALIGCAPRPEAVALTSEPKAEKPAPKPTIPEGWNSSGRRGVY